MEAMGERPDDEMYRKMGDFGLIACRLGPGPHLKGFNLPAGVKPEEVIGLPPILKFGPKWMQEKVVPPILKGEKKICLAISDPGAGSDVSGISCVAELFSRLASEECFKWASQRKVFGKPLIEQPVVRFKLGQMISEVEALQYYVEGITYQMTKMSYKDQNIHLAGPIALLKYRSTRVTYAVSDNAVQIFGGRAITRSGMGRIIEQFQRTNKFGAILGGAEEVLADLGVRQAMKFYPKNARL
ncbi:hypothetical protein HK405_009904 [Cladochytrium tenue]|nr:hypothetical protein HK405_009904 [Cladochytrium tenue]